MRKGSRGEISFGNSRFWSTGTLLPVPSAKDNSRCHRWERLVQNVSALFFCDDYVYEHAMDVVDRPTFHGSGEI
jgi:hypothetical protein